MLVLMEGILINAQVVFLCIFTVTPSFNTCVFIETLFVQLLINLVVWQSGFPVALLL